MLCPVADRYVYSEPVKASVGIGPDIVEMAFVNENALLLVLLRLPLLLVLLPLVVLDVSCALVATARHSSHNAVGSILVL